MLGRIETEVLNIDFSEFLHGFECPIVSGSSFPWNTFRRRNVSAAKNALLRIFGHMRNLSSEFAGGSYVDERLAPFALRQCLFIERTNLVIRSPGRNGVLSRSVLRDFSSKFPLFGDPFIPSSVCDSKVFVPEKRENPKSIASPPIRFIPVKNHGSVGGYPNSTC